MLEPSMEFLSLANTATNMYIQNGKPLDEAIAKLASERDLSQVQIQRVVELANHETNERLMKRASDRTFRFDVASLDGVLARLGVNQAGHTKVAKYQVAEAMDEFVDTAANLAYVEKLAGKMLEDGRLADIRVAKASQDMKKIAEHYVVYRRKTMAKLAGLHVDIRESINELCDYAKSHVINGGSVAELHKFACNYDRANGPMWDVLFSSVIDNLPKFGGIFKTAKMAPLPKNDKVPYDVVNGKHTLIIFLDTLKNKISQEDMLAKRLKLMDTHGPAVVTMIKTLDTNKDVKDYIANHIEKTAAAVKDEDGFAEKLAGMFSAIASGVDGTRKALNSTLGIPGQLATKAISSVSSGVSKIPFVGRPAELALDVASVPFRLLSKPGNVMAAAALLGLFGAARGAGIGIKNAMRPVVYKQ